MFNSCSKRLVEFFHILMYNYIVTRQYNKYLGGTSYA